MQAPRQTDVALIGAGPYGLSLSAHLAASGVRFRTFGRVMDAWRSNMPQGMCLKSPGRASSLADPSGRHTLEAFCNATGLVYSDWEHPVSGEVFTRYGEWFQKILVPGVDTRQVIACERDSQGFLLRLEDGESIAAKSVVISSGYMASTQMPEELAGLPADLVSHSSQHSSFTRFRDKDVIVLGAGQSALESAALLREAGARPTLAARTEAILWGGPERGDRTVLEKLRRPRTGLSFGWRFVFYEHPSTPFHYLPTSVRKKQVDTTLGPLGAWWLRERVEGRMPILLGWNLQEARAEEGRITLRGRQGGQQVDLQADHVIAATGYRIGQASFPFLSGALREAIRWEHGSPALSGGFESSVPGLHFIGLASAYSFGPVMRFVAGAHVMAPRLCGRLAARHRRSPALSLEQSMVVERAG